LSDKLKDIPTKNGKLSLMPSTKRIKEMVVFISQTEFTPIMLEAKRKGLHPLVTMNP